MKILLLEFSPTIVGHQRLFQKTFSILDRTEEVSVILPKGRKKEWESIPGASQHIIETPFDVGMPNSKMSGIMTKYVKIRACRQIVKFAKKLDKKCNYDAIICVTYDEMSYFFSYRVFGHTQKVFLMHHDNLDRFNVSSLRKSMFRMFSKEVKHIVLAQFMKEHLIEEYGINSEDVIVYMHPMYRNETLDQPQQLDFDCVGISNSNDITFIDKLIEEEKQYGNLRKNNLHVVLRTNGDTYDDGYLQIIKGRLTKDEYDNYINNAKSILVPLDSNFKYRMSASIIEALSNFKPVLCTEVLLTQKFRDVYPSVCSLLEEIDLTKSLGEILYNQRQEEYLKFYNYHCDDYLHETMVRQISAALKGESISIDTDC